MFALLLIGSLLIAGGSEPVLYVLGQINNSEEDDDVTLNKEQFQLATTSNSTDFKLYQKLIPELQELVELRYPSNWTLYENEDFQDYGYIAELSSPLTGENDTFKEKVKIFVDPITNLATDNRSLAEYVDETIELYKNESIHFEVIESNMEHTGEFPSYRIVYQAQDEDSEQIWKRAEFGYLVGNDVYLLQFLSENPTQYEQYQQILNHTFSSFQVVQFLPYYNTELGVYLQYPSSFINYGSRFALFDDSLNEEVGNFTLFKFPVERGNQSILDQEDEIIRYMNERDPNFFLIERSDTNSSTILTRRILANHTEEDGLFNEWLLGISNGNLYGIRFEFPPKYYDYFQLVKTRMMNNFVAFKLYPYVSSNFDIFVEYPSSWEKFENDSGSSSDRHTKQEINFVSPRENSKTDEFQENLVISTSYNVSDSLDSKIDLHISMLSRSYSGFKLVERSHISIGSLLGNSSLIPAQKIIYRYAERDDPKDKQVLEIWAKNRENKLYQITFVSALDRYDNYAEIAGRMIGSVHLYEDQKIATMPSVKLVTFNHSATGTSIKHPETWKVEQFNDTATGQHMFEFLSPDDEDQIFQDFISLAIAPSKGTLLHDEISATIGTLATDFEPNLGIIDSSPFTLWSENSDNDIQAHRMISYYVSAQKIPIYQITIIAQKNDMLYSLSYYADIDRSEDRSGDHLLEFIQAVNSFDLQKMSADLLQFSSENETGLDGIPVQGYPYDVATDPVYQKLLVAAIRAGAVLVMDAETGGIIETVKVGKMPTEIALQGALGSAYVANCMSDSLSAIDLSTNELIDTIDVGKAPLDVAISSIGDIYVINHGSRSISVIDPISNLVTKNITLPINPIAIATNEYTNRIYVSGYEDENISNACIGSVGDHKGNLIIVMDAGSNEIIDTIDSDSIELNDDYNDAIEFQAIAVHPATNTIYAANILSNTLYKIDGNTNEIIGRIEVGFFGPDTVEVNPVTGKVYVSSYTDGRISVIDGRSDPVLVETVGNPTSIAIDSHNNKVYFNNYHANTVNEMNGETNKLMYAINLTISPAGSGKIVCGNEQMNIEEKEYSSDIRVIYDKDTKITCIAYGATNRNLWSFGSIVGLIIPPLEDLLETGLNKNYKFSSWSGTVRQVSNATVSLNLSQYHDLVANFQEAPPILAKEYRITIFGIFLTVVIPFIVRWLYQRQKKKKEMGEQTI